MRNRTSHLRIPQSDALKHGSAEYEGLKLFSISLSKHIPRFHALEHRTAESEGVRFDSSWELRMFSLSHARDKTKNIFFYFLTGLKTYRLDM